MALFLFFPVKCEKVSFLAPGKMLLSSPLHVPQGSSVVFLNNKSFIDPACSVKMAGY